MEWKGMSQEKRRMRHQCRTSSLLFSLLTLQGSAGHHLHRGQDAEDVGHHGEHYPHHDGATGRHHGPHRGRAGRRQRLVPAADPGHHRAVRPRHERQLPAGQGGQLPQDDPGGAGQTGTHHATYLLYA